MVNETNPMLSQIEAELTKSATEALKGKLKALVVRRNEAQKVVAGINLEIAKMIEDHENGVS